MAVRSSPHMSCRNRHYRAARHGAVAEQGGKTENAVDIQHHRRIDRSSRTRVGRTFPCIMMARISTSTATARASGSWCHRDRPPCGPANSAWCATRSEASNAPHQHRRHGDQHQAALFGQLMFSKKGCKRKTKGEEEGFFLGQCGHWGRAFLRGIVEKWRGFLGVQVWNMHWRQTSEHNLQFRREDEIVLLREDDAVNIRAFPVTVENRFSVGNAWKQRVRAAICFNQIERRSKQRWISL